MRTRPCTVALLLHLSLLAGACSDADQQEAESTVENAAEDVKRTAEGTVDAVGDAASKAGDAIKDATAGSRGEVGDSSASRDTVPR